MRHHPYQYEFALIPRPKDTIIMAADQSNENRGALFRDQNKKSDRAPDMTGHLTINGVRYRLAGWTREDRSGRKYLSLSAEPPREDQHPAPPQPQPQAGNIYAQATRGDRAEPQPQGGGKSWLDGDIPFSPEVR